MDIENIVDEIISDIDSENGNGIIYASQFIERLENYGFMIVPIEDPTNLFGVMEDSI